MKLISLNALNQYPIRRNHYDKENGNEHFIYGVESVIEYANSLPTYDSLDVLSEIPIVMNISNFDLEKIANSGQCFRWFKTESRYPNTNIAYDIVAFNKVLHIEQGNGSMIIFDCDERDFNLSWRRYFDIDLDYNEIVSLLDASDKFLDKACQYGEGIRILRQPLWETVVSFIISQRKSIPAIKTSIERLCRAYGSKIEGTEYYRFPRPYELTDMSKYDCGLGYRLEYIQSLANKVMNWEFDLTSLLNASYEDAKKMLLSVKGIGEKVANCILLFALHHLEACPRDVWINRIVEEEYNGVTPKWMESQYAGIFQQYAFFYKRSK